MGTRSNIFIENLDSTFTGIYCQFDGYLDYNGVVLYQAYQTAEKLQKLIDLGDISSLGAETIPSPLVEKFGFDYQSNPEYQALSKEEQERLQQEARKDNEQDLPIYTTAYHRDRGEEELNQMHVQSFQDVIDQQGGMIEYVYVATRKKDGSLCWYVKSYDHFGFLEDILLEQHLI